MITKEELEKEIEKKLAAKVEEMKYEICVRDGKPYLRKVPWSRDKVEKMTKRRLANILQFATIAHNNYGKPFEEHINTMKEKMKPIGREIKLREIILTQKMLADIRQKLLKKNINRLTLPTGYIVKVIER